MKRLIDGVWTVRLSLDGDLDSAAEELVGAKLSSILAGCKNFGIVTREEIDLTDWCNFSVRVLPANEAGKASMEYVIDGDVVACATSVFDGTSVTHHFYSLFPEKSSGREGGPAQ